jgi:hypothetical protein
MYYRNVDGLAPPNLWQQGCSPDTPNINRRAWTMMTTSIVWWRTAAYEQLAFGYDFPIDGILGWDFYPFLKYQAARLKISGALQMHFSTSLQGLIQIDSKVCNDSMDELKAHPNQLNSWFIPMFRVLVICP